MARKILKTHTPLIGTYPHHANLFSIIGNSKKIMEWVLHNYLHLFLSSNNDSEFGMDLCSQYYPWHSFDGDAVHF